MSNTTFIEPALIQLDASSAEIRLEGAGRLGDFLERGHLDERATALVVDALVRAAAKERSRQALNEMLNSLMLTRCELCLPGVSFEPIATMLPRLRSEELEFALRVLGHTGDSAYVEAIKPFVVNADPHVRDAAADAITEIRSRNDSQASA